MLRGRSYAPARVALRATVLATLVTGAALVAATGARAEEVVNVTLNIPAAARDNPCAGEPLVSLSGTLHIVYYVRSDGNGGFHINHLVDDKLSGQGFTSGERYQASDTWDHSFYAGAPFPANDTIVHTVVLLSAGGSDNLVMGYRLHTTVNALGVPTAAVEDITLKCAG
jgi:hypothetical protein